MAKPVKTNVLRSLDAARIPYETREYDCEDGNFDGKLIPGKTGMDPDTVYKTLVLCGDGQEHLVCIIPVDQELDLKKTARAAGQKSVSMLPQKELLGLTGYVRGGCSPIGMKKSFPAFLQEEAQLYERIAVSAGVRGCMVLLAPEELTRLTGAEYADLCRRIEGHD